MRCEHIYTPNAPIPQGPYAQATKANGFVFVTGQVSRDAKSGDFVDGSFEEQLRLSIRNLEAILLASGSSFRQVLMLNIFYLQRDDIAILNNVLGEFFVDAPARSSLGVAFLWKKCKVMIDATALAE